VLTITESAAHDVPAPHPLRLPLEAGTMTPLSAGSSAEAPPGFLPAGEGEPVDPQ